MRKVKLVASLLAVMLLGSACSLYSNADGSAYLNGTQAQFVIIPSVSGILTNLYIDTCGFNFDCYTGIVLPQLQQSGDLVGYEAILDQGPGNNTFGVDELEAMSGRLWVSPNAGDPNRCLSFQVNPNVGFGGADPYFDQGSWTWFRPGNWNC